MQSNICMLLAISFWVSAIYVIVIEFEKKKEREKKCLEEWMYCFTPFLTASWILIRLFVDDEYQNSMCIIITCDFISAHCNKGYCP